jgi:hypothetical protein
MKRIVVAALVLFPAVGVVTCGGTTGREGLPMPQPVPTGSTDASVDGMGDAGDATISNANDSGWFDVVIEYADRALPEVSAPPEAGGDAGSRWPWPDCPPWVAELNGKPVPVEQVSYDYEVPAEYDDAGDVLLNDAGKVVLMPEGSACTSYGWMGSPAADKCTANNVYSTPYILFPPCNWCMEAGVAGAGPGAGLPLYDLCLSLYQCMMHTGCGAKTAGYCLCGGNGMQVTGNCDGGGPCALEELAALQLSSDPVSIQTALMHFTDVNLGSPGPGYCAEFLNNEFSNAQNYSCVVVDGGR